MAVALIFMIVLAGVAGASFFFYRKAKQMERQQLPSGYGGGGGFTPAGQLPGPTGGSGNNLMNLRVNDIVSYFGTDYIIEGKLNYWEDGYTWVTYMLVDGDDVQWLSVEEDDMLEVSMWQEVRDLHLRAPLPEFVDYQGDRFRMVERGQARVNQQGRTGNKTGLQMEYYEYEGDGEEMLSVEKWGNEIEVSYGREINPAALDILPGDAIEY